MVIKILQSVVCFTLFMSTFAGTCKEPELRVKTFTNEDATVLTHIAFISEFTMSCDNIKESSNLYAAFDDNLIPVSRTGDNKYQVIEVISFHICIYLTHILTQVSWVEELGIASTGYRQITLYDEEGYAGYRKALRAGEPITNVPVVAEFALNHPGAYMGPWLKSEFIAAALSLAVAYLAFSSRGKLLA